MSKAKTVFWISAGLFVILMALFSWSATANTDFYYNLDKLVGGDGDGDGFFVLSGFLMVIDAIVVITSGIYAFLVKQKTTAA